MSQKKQKRTNLAERQADLSRRGFVAGAAAAVALPYFVPGSALGRNGAVAPSERITVGVIGAGNRGVHHTKGFSSRPDSEVLAVCDPQQKKRLGTRALAEKQSKGCKDYADFRDILARDDIDAVAIASPENWHALHGAMACEAGKDVYGEKALTLTVAEGRALCKTVRCYGRIFQAGTQQRSDQRFRFACELARNGYLGTLQRVKVGVPGGRALPNAPAKPAPPDIDYDLWLGPAPQTPYNDLKCSFNWYFIQDYCAGWIQSWGVHHCDIALWGAPTLHAGKVQVSGTAVFPTEGIANTSITWNTEIVTPGGLRMTFCDNKTPDHRQGCRFEGTKGWVHVTRGGIRAEPASLLQVKLKPDDEHLYESRDHHGNFLECIRTRRDPAAPVEACHAATTISLIADIATRLERKLTWDWAAERFVDDAAANRMLRRSMRAPWTL